jgi:hypothetical protein
MTYAVIWASALEIWLKGDILNLYDDGLSAF